MLLDLHCTACSLNILILCQNNTSERSCAHLFRIILDTFTLNQGPLNEPKVYQGNYSIQQILRQNLKRGSQNSVGGV